MDQEPGNMTDTEEAPPPEVAGESKPALETAPEGALPEPTGAVSEDTQPPGVKPVSKAKKPAATKKAVTKKAVTKKPTTKKKPAKAAPRQDVPKNLMMPLSRIELSETWNRRELGDNSGMISSLKDMGQISPISIWPIPGSTKYKLIVGRRRYAGAVELGWKTIKVTICKGNLADLKLQALAENLERKENTPFELAVGFRQLVDELGKTNEQIATSCGKTPGFVSQHLAVTKAPKKLQQGLAKGKVGVSIFRYFTKLDPTEDKPFYDKMVSAALEGMSGNKIDEKVTAYLEKKTEKAAVKAKATGKKNTPKPQKGAAAHKKKKGARLFIRDYADPEVRKAVKMVAKTTALERLEETAGKLRRATRKDRKDYLQGVIDGIEECSGLVSVSQD